MELIIHFYSGDFVVYWRTSARSKVQRDLISRKISRCDTNALFRCQKSHNDSLIMATPQAGGRKLLFLAGDN